MKVNCSIRRFWFLVSILILSLFLITSIPSFSQLAPVDSLKADSLRILKGKIPVREDLSAQYDVGDLAHDIFHSDKKNDSLRKKSGISIIPNVASNPSIGSQIGIKAVAGLHFGDDPSTLMSVGATAASITTKGILYFYVNHNIFTNANKWNVQGSLVIAKTVIPDFGLGIGYVSGTTEEDKILTNPDRNEYELHSLYYNFREKIYKNIFTNAFIGAGVSFDIRRKIENKETALDEQTPNSIYSDRFGFDPRNYMANGLLFSFQYTTRDNQNRAYKGIFADFGVRANQTWMGSTRDALQFTSDFRKYFSLSKKNPEHVLAFWNWGSYLLSGALPYLELTGTGKDANGHSGRGYTVTYFKGTQYSCSEVEYRFPITKNKFFSGVTFFNIQTANDEVGYKLFQKWQPGGGVGLRVLFNKATRTNLCLDYAYGRYGSHGFFLGLNEVF